MGEVHVYKMLEEKPVHASSFINLRGGTQLRMRRTGWACQALERLFRQGFCRLLTKVRRRALCATIVWLCSIGCCLQWLCTWTIRRGFNERFQGESERSIKTSQERGLAGSAVGADRWVLTCNTEGEISSTRYHSGGISRSILLRFSETIPNRKKKLRR